MSITEILSKVYVEYSSAKAVPFGDHPMLDFFHNAIPTSLYQSGLIKQEKYLVSASAGQGNWAQVPWIGIFDKNVTMSAMRGIYIVYLFSADYQKAYLTLDQGTTDLKLSQGRKSTVEALHNRADTIISTLNPRGFSNARNMSLGAKLTERAKLFQEGAIFYKEYHLNNLPDEETLQNDLKNMLLLYQDYTAKFMFGSELLPSNREYTPELKVGKFDSWEIIDETTAVKNCDKSFFEHNGSGVPKGICWFFDADELQLGETKNITIVFQGNEYFGRIANESSDRRRVNIYWNPELGRAFNSLRTDGPQRLQFKKSEDHYTVQFIGGEEEVPVLAKEYMKPIKDYIAAKGFSYDGRLIENFYLSLKTKPFVILAGTSGTGKTRLVKLFAEAIGAEYQLVPVRPDWSDSSDLFGHMDLNGKFVPGAVIDFIKSAQDHPGKPYFLCLDEMNLARVEYYLSDVLAVIETRDLNGKIITSDPLIDLDKYGSDENAKAKYGKICFPQNLYIVGTVNMDETTFPFSKKVLDRANTIEFNFVDLRPSFDTITDMPDKLQLPNSFLQSEYLLLAQCNKDVAFVSEICNELQQINEILQKANAHIGYRVRDEIVFYLLNNKNEGELLSRNEAMDNAIMQKILPRIQGSSASIHDMLCELFKICGGDHNQRSGDSDADKMWKVVSDNSANCKYPNSAKKLQMMVRRFEEDGFTSFWL